MKWECLCKSQNWKNCLFWHDICNYNKKTTSLSYHMLSELLIKKKLHTSLKNFNILLWTSQRGSSVVWPYSARTDMNIASVNLRCLQVNKLVGWFWWFMVFNATFNNIPVISWRSVLLVEDTGVPWENHRPVASGWQTLSYNVVHFAMNGVLTHNFSDDRHWMHM